MDKQNMLYYLRQKEHQYIIDEIIAARLQAADELERLYRMEEKTKVLINKIEHFLTDKTMEG